MNKPKMAIVKAKIRCLIHFCLQKIKDISCPKIAPRPTKPNPDKLLPKNRIMHKIEPKSMPKNMP